MVAVPIVLFERTEPDPLRTALLACGVLAALVYAGGDLLSVLAYDGYSYRDWTISELAAIESPVRPLFVPLLTIHTALLVAFAFGVWRAAASRALGAVAALLLADAVIGFATPPMHVRYFSVTMSLTDVMHIVGTSASVACIVAAMILAATAFGPRFRAYSIVTVLVMLGFGAWAGFQGADLAAGLPTPWMGIRERLSVGSYILWLGVLAVALLRERNAPR